MIELPDLAMPRPVTKAASVVREREHDAATAKEAVELAKQRVARAIVEDRERAATALDRGAPDPGREAEQAARHDLDEAERRLGIEDVRLSRAREALDAALVDALPAWEAKLTEATIAAETQALELVGQLEAAVRERALRRQALAWARNRAEGGTKALIVQPIATASPLVINVQASPFATHSVEALLGFVREGLERARLSAEAESAAEREQQADGEPPVLRVAES